MRAPRAPRRPAWSLFDLAVTLLLMPWFVFPDPAVTPWLLLAFPALWVLRRLVQGRWSVRTPIDAPLLLLVAMVGVSAWATYDLTLSFPKIAGVLYGIALAYALANDLHTERRLWVGVAGLVLLGAGVIAVGFVGTAWGGAAQMPALEPLVEALRDRFPQRLTGVPRAEGGFNTNQVAGTLALILPLYVSLAVGLLRAVPITEDEPRLMKRMVDTLTHGVGGLALIGLALAAALLLLLTQSRGAIAWTALALGGWLAAQGRVGRWLAGLGALAVLVAVLIIGPQEAAWALFGVEVAGGGIGLRGRLEIWHRAWRVLRDHAAAGIGFDTLVPVIHARYPTFYFDETADFTHAHNHFFQVGLDVGVPGLIAFLALLMAYGRSLIAVARRALSRRSAASRGPAPGTRALAEGLLFGVAAQMLFGLTDAIALGQKPGLLFWIAVGLGLALVRIADPVGGRVRDG